jgi:YVTN family beta-propeller protein
MVRNQGRPLRPGLILVVALALAGVFATSADASSARTVYASLGTADSVAYFPSPADTPVLSISPTVGPRFLAITPNGAFAYLSQSASSVTVLNTATNGVSGSPITSVGDGPVAISPDGSKAYVVNGGSTSISVINTATNTLGTPISDGGNFPRALAVSPDGSRIYALSTNTVARVTVIDAATGSVIGTPINVGTTPTPASQWIAVTPDGSEAYVANIEGDVTVINLAGATVSTNVPLGSGVTSLAVSPDGSEVYATKLDNTVSVISTATDAVVGSPIAVGTTPVSVAFSPSGLRAYVLTVNSIPEVVSVIDTTTRTPLAPVQVAASNPGGASIAIVPDQGPVADFSSSPAPAGSPTSVNGGSSSDSDGTVARYDWDFGDGHQLADGGATPTHTYASAGDYDVTLTVTDNEGCSAGFSYTGQTASCNGGPAAVKTSQVSILPPPPPPPPPPAQSSSSTGERAAALKKCKKKKSAKARKKCKKKASLLPV